MNHPPTPCKTVFTSSRWNGEVHRYRLLPGILAVLMPTHLLAGTATIPPVSTSGPAGVYYQVQDGGFVKLNGERYHNRPLYGANQPALVLAGDRPSLRYLHQPYIGGHLQFAILRDGQARWVHELAERSARYEPGSMHWTLADPLLGEATLRIDAVSLADGPGFVVRAHVEGLTSDKLQLLWLFGGSVDPGADFLFWEQDPQTHPDLLARGFRSDDALGNQPVLDGAAFRLTVPPHARRPQYTPLQLAGRCSAGLPPQLADAAHYARPADLLAHPAADRPVVVGTVALTPDTSEIFWIIRSAQGDTPVPAESLAAPAEAFSAALERVAAIAHRVIACTPDPRFDAAVTATAVALDGAWYPPVYVHGGLSWNVPFPGWRCTYGPTTFGWHNHVAEEGRYYISHQTVESPLTGARGEPTLGLSIQATDTRFYGKGHIARDQHFYNFQEVFFDQVIHAWRWANPAGLETILRPALDLHLDWLRDCFDPDGDGAYESYINVWASDSVWYSGGATVQSSAYAYAGHRAAAELADRAGDADAAQRHRDRADTIRQGTFEQLWIPELGHFAEYREALGHRRRHDDACLYTVCLSIDAGMLDAFQAAQQLEYTRWGLERVAMPAGGQQCWHSNWVPYIWSVRELTPAETAHLALSYYQAGLPDDGWILMEGAFADSMLNSCVPGGIQVPNGGTDFTDASSMVARAMIEGLFGIVPDRPHGKVRIRPMLPGTWDHAEVTTPDAQVRFDRRTPERPRCEISLPQPAELTIELPIHAKAVRAVHCDGRPIAYTTTPGFEQTLLRVAIPATRSAALEVELADPLPTTPPQEIAAAIHTSFEIQETIGPIEAWQDPQGVLTDAALVDGMLRGRWANRPGHHLLFVRVRTGELQQWRRVRVLLNDPTPAPAALPTAPADAHFTCVDIASAFNADVRTIYQQEYLSPRPATCSAQIGTNGYSPWTFYFWKINPPTITLDGVPGLLDTDGRLRTPQNVPFIPPATTGHNIAFTSLWDNWPDRLTVSVGRPAQAAWCLIAGSTNPMQTRIANARLIYAYDDGSQEIVELNHPTNYWSLSETYDLRRDRFALPDPPPPMIQLGQHCRAMVIGHNLPAGRVLRSITLEALSPEIVAGLMGVTLQNR